MSAWVNMRDESVEVQPQVPDADWHCTAASLVVPAPAISADTLCAPAITLLNGHPDWPSLCVVDEQGAIVGLLSRRTCLSILAKPLMRDLYGRRPVERIMQPSPLCVDVDDTLDTISQRIADGAPEALLDGFVVTRGGRYAGVATPQSLLLHSVEQARRRAIVLDVARRQAEQANLAKSSFLANLSHEIRTPLNGVLANLELLALTQAPPEQADLVGAATVAANALFDIIGDVLDLSKIEAGRLTIECIPMRPATLCHDIGLLMTTQTAQRGLTFGCHIDPAATAEVEGDPTRLRQIIMNITGNALKFTQQGGIFLSLFRTERADGEGLEFWVEVADTGVGFASDKAEQLFEAFTQEDASTTRKFGGTGLGLSICRKLAELMGGTIQADGGTGEGATFWLRLPFRPVAASEPEPVNVTDLRVMLVSANAAWRERQAGMLTAAGAIVCGTGAVDLALKEIGRADHGQRPIDVVAVELSAEDEATLTVPASLEGTGAVPVMLTRIEDVGLRRKGYRCGYRHVATIPARPEELTWAVAVAAGRHRPLSSAGGTAPAPDIIALSAALAGARGARILVIDDNGMNQLVARRQLNRLGFDCDVAANGREGLSQVERHAYDLIFCDVQMPEMDGCDFTRALRAHEAQSQAPRLPIVAMTASAMGGDGQRCLDAGMDDFITKPVKIERMAEALRCWLPAAGHATTPAAPRPPGEAGGNSSEAAEPPIDRAALTELLGVDSEEAHIEVMGMFLEFFPDLGAAVRRAADGADREALRRHAHTAKGAARNAAARRLGDLLDRIEHVAPAAAWDELTRLVAAADNEYQRVIAYIAALSPAALPPSQDAAE